LKNGRVGRKRTEIKKFTAKGASIRTWADGGPPTEKTHNNGSLRVEGRKKGSQKYRTMGSSSHKGKCPGVKSPSIKAPEKGKE